MAVHHFLGFLDSHRHRHQNLSVPSPSQFSKPHGDGNSILDGITITIRPIQSQTRYHSSDNNSGVIHPRRQQQQHLSPTMLHHPFGTTNSSSFQHQELTLVVNLKQHQLNYVVM